MDMLDIFAWIVLFILLASAVAVLFVLASLPGRIARNRSHAQAEAITVAGWMGALVLGVFWPLALIWAFTVSPNSAGPSDQDAQSNPGSRK